MPVRATCPACGTTLQANDELLGKKVRCGKCQNVFVVAEDADEEIEVVPQYRGRRSANDHGGKAMASMIIGICALIGWCLPLVGLPMSVTGLSLGIVARNSTVNRGQALAGMIMNGISLVLSLGNAALGVYLMSTGKHPMFR